MKKFRKHLLIGVAALTLGAGTVAAYAEHPGCDGHGPGHGASAGHGKFGERMRQRMEQRINELHAKLKLDTTQESAWKEYVAKMRPEAPPQRPQRPDPAESGKLTAPERMDRMVTLMKQREARMEERAAATRTFYATLTPPQQQVFNDAFPGRHHRPEHGAPH